MRLTSVDLPTFGRPTTARTGAAGSTSSSSNPPSSTAPSSGPKSPGSIPSCVMYATSSCSLTVAPYLVQFDDQPGQRGPDGLGGGDQPGPAAARGHRERRADQHVHP